MYTTNRIASTVMIAFFILLLGSQHTLSADYENTVTLDAATVFPKTPLKGTSYQVEPKVTTDGFLTRTTISSQFGSFEAVGPGMLAIRLNEIEALTKTQTFEGSEEFKKGAKESAGEKWDALKIMADNPKETLKGTGEGISRFFHRTVRSTKTGIQEMDDVLHDRIPGTEATAGSGAKLPGASPDGPKISEQSKYAKAAQASGNVAVNILGFEDSRRKLAKRLKVDPYTTNQVLDDKLDEITWSIFAGDLGVDIATSLIPGAVIVSSSTLVTNWVWDTPPGDLKVKIEQKLLAMDIEQDTVDRLLRHHYYTLTMQAAITTYLEQLKGVQGRKDIMPLALSVTSIDQARFVTGTLMMISRYHQEVNPLKSIESTGTIIAHTGDGKAVVLAPVDYLSWSQSMDNFSARGEFTSGKTTLYTAGSVSKLALTMLEKRGWRVNDHSTLFGKADQ